MGIVLNGGPAELRVAVAGLGAIGIKLAQALDQGIDGYILSAVSAQSPAKHREFLATLKKPPVMLPIETLSDAADLVIECAPANLLGSIIAPFVSKGQTVVPTGALIGLDAVTAAAEGKIASVRMITRKPVKGLLGAPYLVENNIDIETITEPLRIFEGTAREAAKGFPANLNVAVALSLAGIGPDRTRLEIWADPALTRNVHRVEVDSDAARFSMSIENVPSENPKTGMITALSVIAWLRKQRAALRVGT